jgi:MFS family permease
VFGLAGNLVSVILAAFVYGIGISTANLTWTNTLQEMVPQEKLGRVTSVDAVGSFVLLPIGFALAGVLTDAIGSANVFLLGGSIAALLGALMLLVPSIRRLD